MSVHFPLEFTLDNGVHVVVNKTGENTYDFSFTPPDGPERHLLYDDTRPKDQVIEGADFDELNAIRRFWLEREEIV